MKSHLLSAAAAIIPPTMLVNVISQRVRQLTFGHRPLVTCPPGTGLADIALTEVIEKKLTYKSLLGLDENGEKIEPAVSAGKTEPSRVSSKIAEMETAVAPRKRRASLAKAA